MALKTLARPIGTLLAVEDLAKRWEAMTAELGNSLADLPDEWRADIADELEDKFRALVTLKATAGASEQAGLFDQQGHDGPPQIRRDSLAAAAFQVLQINAPLSAQEIADELQRKGQGRDKEDFGTVVNSALWRRKDVFRKVGGKYSLVTFEVDFVDG